MERGRTKYQYWRNWLLIFHHNIDKGHFSPDKSDCYESNIPGKYSAIGLINELFKINEYYEFLLEYPENGSIVWKQKISPMNFTETSIENDDIGLDILYNRHNFAYFKGIMKSSSSSCFDCDNYKLSNFWYSIGLINTGHSKIPGPKIGSKNIEVNEVSLWIRVPSYLTCNCKQSRSIHNSILFICILLS